MSTIRDFKQCSGELAEKVTRLLMAMDCLGHPVFITETFRPQARQDELYAQGRTKPGVQVTWTKHSRHTDGCAVDLAFDDAEPWSEAHPWDLLKTCAEAIGLHGLGARDRGHWEI